MIVYTDRKDIPLEYTWNTDTLYENEEAWQADFDKLKALYPRLNEFRGTLGDNPARLLSFFRFDEELSRLMDKVYLYAQMKKDEDNGNAHNSGLQQRVQALAVEISTAGSFAQVELLAIPEETIEAWLLNVELSPYRRFFEKLAHEKAHTLSDKEEELLAMAGEVTGSSRQIFSMLNNVDLSFSPVVTAEGESPLTHGNFVLFLENTDRKVRKEAFTNLYEAYGALRHTFGATLGANVKKNVFASRVRKFPTALAAAVHYEEVSPKVYQNLLEVVNDKLPLFHRYLELRRKALGVDELHLYDVYVSLARDSRADYSYEEACDIVMAALAPLGKEYCDIAEKGLHSRWVDVFENTNKTPGAYSSGVYDSIPYMLLNFQGNLNSVFTLAHELGHSMHSYLTNQAQPYIYSNYEIFVAEVASTVNETLLLLHLLEKETDKERKIELVSYYLDQFRGTVYRQTMFAEFEKMIHNRGEEGLPLDSDYFEEVYYNLNLRYFGKNVAVDKEIALEWARIPHFYRSFYVYKYATGFAAASILANAVYKNGAASAETKSYLEFLSGGSSTDPLSLLARAGADMSKKENIAAAFNVFESMLKELEKLV